MIMNTKMAIPRTALAVALAAGVSTGGCGAKQGNVQGPRKDFSPHHLEASVEISRTDHSKSGDYHLSKSYPDSGDMINRADKDMKDALGAFAQSTGCDSMYRVIVSRRISRLFYNPNNGEMFAQNLVDEKSSIFPSELCQLIEAKKPAPPAVAAPQGPDLSKVPLIDASMTVEVCDAARKCDMVASEKSSGYDVAHLPQSGEYGSIHTFDLTSAILHLGERVSDFADSTECLSYTAGKAEVKVHQSVIRTFPIDAGKSAQTLVDSTTFTKSKGFCTGIMQYPAIEAKVTIEACDAAKKCEVIGGKKYFGYAVPTTSILVQGIMKRPCF